MTDETNADVTHDHAPNRQPALGRPALIGAGIVLVAFIASAAGALIGHELWTSSRSASPAPAPVATPSPGGSGFFGGGSGATGAGGPSNAAAIAAKVNPAVVNIDSSN